MARTKIVIEVESKDERFVRSASRAVITVVRSLLNDFQDAVPEAGAVIVITPDGKNVTEVIQ